MRGNLELRRSNLESHSKNGEETAKKVGLELRRSNCECPQTRMDKKWK